MIQIAAKPQPKTYQLTYLVSASHAEAELTAIKDRVAALVKKHKGEVVSTEDWGKKPLAYPIKYHGQPVVEAIYTHLNLSFLPSQVIAFEKDIYLLDDVIRHLLVVAEKKEQSPATKE